MPPSLRVSFWYRLLLTIKFCRWANSVCYKNPTEDIMWAQTFHGIPEGQEGYLYMCWKTIKVTARSFLELATPLPFKLTQAFHWNSDLPCNLSNGAFVSTVRVPEHQHHEGSASSRVTQQQGFQGHKREALCRKPADQLAACHQQSLGTTASFLERASRIYPLSSLMQQVGKSFDCWLRSHHQVGRKVT